jgi:hypothetical protein
MDWAIQSRAHFYIAYLTSTLQGSNTPIPTPLCGRVPWPLQLTKHLPYTGTSCVLMSFKPGLRAYGTSQRQGLKTPPPFCICRSTEEVSSHQVTPALKYRR